MKKFKKEKFLKIKKITNNMLNLKFEIQSNKKNKTKFISKPKETEHLLPLKLGKCEFELGLGYEMHIVEIAENQIKINIINDILKTKKQIILNDNNKEFFSVPSNDLDLFLIFETVVQ